MTSPLVKARRTTPLAADAAMLALHLDARAHEPLHVQLGRQVRGLILAGRMLPGARLPSSRALSVDLGVSRSTVVLAFDQLLSEGWVESRRGAGMFVAAALPESALPIGDAGRPAQPKSVPRAPPPDVALPFQLGATDARLFPYRHWARLLYRTWRDPVSALTGRIDVFGWPPLRQAIARHLLEWRGITTDAERIVVTSGTADAIELIVRIAFRPGATVFTEEPGYPTLRHTLLGLGLSVKPVAVDAEGFDIRLATTQANARGAVVTPSRQFPLGATLPVARRLALLEWADANAAFIVEDDFDSEYRYQGSPLPALLGLDRNGRTIYLGSFSKVLSPALRLGFVVLPERLVAPARTHLSRRGTLASLVAQPALGQFIADGAYATHIRRTRRIYARRMTALIEASDRLHGLLHLTPSSAGMHVVAELAAPLAQRMSDREVSLRLRQAGLVAPALSDFYAGRANRAGLLLGFAGFSEPALRGAVGGMARQLSKR